MATHPIRQGRFDGGEASPLLYGRTDDPRYGISLRTCKNFLPIQHGALVNRAGSKLVAAAKPGGQPPRFETFIFSDTQTMVLEFGNLYIRFHTNGGQVQLAGVAYEVATPYLDADLARLKFSQSGDVITITHPSYQTQDLSRLSNTNWMLSATSLSPPAGFVVTALAAAPNGYGGDNGLGYNAGTLYQSGQYAFDGAAGTPASYIAIASSVGKQPSANLAWWALAIDATHTAREWDWVVTIKYQDSLGRKLEGLPTAPLKLIPVVRQSDRPVTIQWGAPVAPEFSYKILGFGVYAGRNGLYGWIGDADPTATTFRDEGAAPDFGTQPPRGTDPFLVADGVNTALTHKYPGVVAHHEQRRVYARPDLRPHHFLGSKQDDYSNFDVNFPVQDKDSYDFALASDRLAEIRSMLSLLRLLLFTSDAVYAVEGAPGQAIKPTSVKVRKEAGNHGASYLQSVAVGSAALYVTAKGNRVRSVVFNFMTDSLEGMDISDVAQHLFDGHTLVSMCYADVPYKTVWAVRDDGLLLSCTYDRAAQILAWARHPTRGAVKWVASVPEGTEDAVYISVVRNGQALIERFASRLLPQIPDGIDLETGLPKYRDDVRQAVFLDSSVSFDGRNTLATTMKVSGASFNAGDAVTIDASLAGSFVGAPDVGDRIIIDPDGTPTPVTVTAFTSGTQVAARLEAPLPPEFQGVQTTKWGWARDTIGGLAHLEGLQVTVLADGVVQGPFVVAGGVIGPLQPPALIATAGLSYNSDAELMDMAPSAVKANQKSVAATVWEVVGSRGISAGETFDKPLQPAKLRQVKDNFGAPALVTDQVRVPIKGDWNTGARAVIRQSDPLPLTIVGAIREAVIGGT